MLAFERKVVGSVAGALEASQRAAVEEYVDGALAAMPEYIRAGVAAESLLLGGWHGVWGLVPGRGTVDIVAALERSPILVVRQYARLLRSLVLFAEHELAPVAGGAEG